MDIGCYGVYTSRLVFDEEPTRVLGLIGEDPEMRTDVVTSAMLHFRSGQCVFTCGTQLVPYQRVQILGTQGRIEVEIPVAAENPCTSHAERDNERGRPDAPRIPRMSVQRLDEHPYCRQYSQHPQSRVRQNNHVACTNVNRVFLG